MILDFERPIVELESKIEELKRLSSDPTINITEEVSKLQSKVDKMLKQAYTSLSSWQKVQVARHPERPKFFDYVEYLFTDFMPLAGDRSFGEDQAIVGGFARYQDQAVMIIGHQKGKDTESRMRHNFGMPRPEGYRKAKRLMELADHFNLPILTFVDTAGAYPGIDAEERGQAEAIARCLETCFKVSVPIISTIIGEGGSGGAVAIAGANKVIMLEHSIYSVISPEGCASILWRSSEKASEASQVQKLTAQDLLQLKVIDAVIPEPIGGAHRHPWEVIQKLDVVLLQSLKELMRQEPHAILKDRREKFLKMGQV